MSLVLAFSATRGDRARGPVVGGILDILQTSPWARSDPTLTSDPRANSPSPAPRTESMGGLAIGSDVEDQAIVDFNLLAGWDNTRCFHPAIACRNGDSIG